MIDFRAVTENFLFLTKPNEVTTLVVHGHPGARDREEVLIRPMTPRVGMTKGGAAFTFAAVTKG
jgi:hypothetical protein